jgi:hypothetical protein
MAYVRIGLGLAALAAASLAGAQAPSEWLGQAPLPELVIGYHTAEARGMIVERIPPGETVEQWSRMVTVQRFAGVIARGGTLDEWRGHFLDGLRTDCPGFRGGEATRLAVAGRPAIALRIDCPLNPATGRPETFLLLAIAGRADLHIAQIAFRHLPSAAETAWARTQLASVTLCTREAAAPVCQSGPETAER